MRHPENGLAHLAEAWVAELCGRARLRVKQDRCDGGAQVAPLAGACSPLSRGEAPRVERLGDARYVSRRWVARHQTLDELPRYEWADVRMVRNRVERDAQVPVGIGGRACRDHRREEALLRNRVEARVALHEEHFAVRILRAAAVEARVGLVRARPAESREHARQADDVAAVVSLHRLPVDELRRAVRVQFVETDGEELHHLARVVLVGHAIARRVLLAVAQVRQVEAHHRMERDLIEELAVVAEGVPAEHVEIGSDAALELGDGRVLERDHEDLRQRERDTPAQLILARRGFPPERIHHVAVVEALTGGEARAHGVDVCLVRAARHEELILEPGAVAVRFDFVDLGFGRAERGLIEEARRVRGGRQGICGRRHAREIDPAPLLAGFRAARLGAAAGQTGQRQGKKRGADRLEAEPCPRSAGIRVQELRGIRRGCVS